ncbi:MAG: hypothetical protein A2V65_12170 [Deltaproteobacteria bacterium RBG_13_49_15]|nr:MAG: hypothetical protein A2V65_12170 [Deltaproteobacteria bacterium RBG_13_49_15]
MANLIGSSKFLQEDVTIKQIIFQFLTENFFPIERRLLTGTPLFLLKFDKITYIISLKRAIAELVLGFSNTRHIAFLNRDNQGGRSC